jgi:hypothetical protein
MHETHGSRSFANPLDASSLDITRCKYSSEAAFQYVRRTRERPGRAPIQVNIQCQIVSGEGNALFVESNTALQPVAVRGGAVHDEEVMGSDRRRLLGLLVDPLHFFEVALAFEAT